MKPQRVLGLFSVLSLISSCFFVISYLQLPFLEHKNAEVNEYYASIDAWMNSGGRNWTSIWPLNSMMTTTVNTWGREYKYPSRLYDYTAVRETDRITIPFDFGCLFGVVAITTLVASLLLMLKHKFLNNPKEKNLSIGGN